MGLGNAGDGDDQRRRVGDGGGGGEQHDQRDVGIGRGVDVAGGDGANSANDRGDAGQSIDCQGIDAAVHGDRDLQRQQHTEPDGFGDVGVGNDGDGDHQFRRAGDGGGGGKQHRQRDVGGRGGVDV